MKKIEQKNVLNQIPDPLPEPVRENRSAEVAGVAEITDEQNKTQPNNNRPVTPNKEVGTCNPNPKNR